MQSNIAPELHMELVKLVRQELEQQLQMRRENRSVYHVMIKDFENEMKLYNKYTDHFVLKDGTLRDVNLDSEKYAVKIRDGIGTLLRAMYHVDYIVRLPASEEPEMRRFIRGVLDLMKECCPPQSQEIAT